MMAALHDVQVRSINRADIEDFIRQWERPDGAVMGVLGADTHSPVAPVARG